ncbi:MAG: right-handed parallel beta-helix repeat-containing protein [Desulfobacteraceae bacterium]|nr:MAG: right-handed parallel beta-helix repeat-containing protein [Desulfobacteraceae bacterium]
MGRSILIINLILGLCFFPGASLADFYVIAGSRAAGEEIKSLPCTISSSGFYYITRNLSCGAGSHGITVASDNVTIDLMGFSISGPGTGTYHGIYMNARSNVEIRNGTVTGFGSNGIYEQSQLSGRDHRIYNIRARLNKGGGIIIFGKGAHIVNCTASENTKQGIFAGQRSKVVGNTAIKNKTDGIWGNGASLIARNVSRENDVRGIFAAAGSTITENTVYKNGDRGIVAGSGCVITNNTSSHNLDSGIDAYTGSVVSGNTCYANEEHGIEASSAVIVRGNTSFLNGCYGISLTWDAFVDENLSYSNNQSLGAYLNIGPCNRCTFGLNLAP